MAKKPDYEKRKKQLEDLLEQAQEGTKEVFESEKYKNFLKVMSKFHHYSFRNNLLITFQKPDATHIAGYQAWKTKFNRQVQKGEKGIQILGYTPYYRTDIVQIKDQNGNTVLDSDGNDKTEKRKVLVPSFSPVYVFDISQTAGEPLPQLINELDGSVEAYNELFNAISLSSKYKVEFEDIKGGAKGYCDYINQKIAVNNGMSEVQNIKTLIHEVTHADLHVPEVEQTIKKDSRTREIEAESTAFVVCNHYGIDTSEYSFGYLAGWSSSKELEELQSALETIQVQANELIDRIDEKLFELQKDKSIEKETTVENKLEEKSSVKFSIYQIPEGKDFRDIRFLSYKELENQNLNPKIDDYIKIYEDHLPNNLTLDDIFVEFNNNLPDNYKGRSISVSDVIVIDDGKSPEAYYVDNFAYVELPSFAVEHDLNKGKEINILDIASLEPKKEDVIKDENSYFKYYSTQRPVSLGTYPKANSVNIFNYDTKTTIEKDNIEAWGYIEYKEPLTEKQLQDYELKPDKSTDRRIREMLDNIVFDGEIDLDKVKEPNKNKISMEDKFKNAIAEADKRNNNQDKQKSIKEIEHQI